jgi:hypothetical protein
VRRCAGRRVGVRGRYGLSARGLAAWQRLRLEALANAGPDVLALETVPDIDEAEALMAAIAGLGTLSTPGTATPGSPRRFISAETVDHNVSAVLAKLDEPTGEVAASHAALLGLAGPAET